MSGAGSGPVTGSVTGSVTGTSTLPAPDGERARPGALADTPVLALSNVSRSFGPIEVLHGVSLSLRPGRVHALIGENGAGKSTTMKILAGYQPPSAGRVLLDGAEAVFAGPGAAEAAGVAMIHQEFNLAEQLTVEENLFLGRELRRGPFLDKPAMRARTRALLDRLDCRVAVDRTVSTLSNSDKQMVEIAKALLSEARVLVMDEPTAVLTRAETAVLMRQVRALRAGGTAVLFTSHKLDEVREIADDLTIMRDGRVVWQGPAAAMSEQAMAEAMVGREVRDLYPPKDGAPGPMLLEVEGLEVPCHARGLSFTLRAGEILGVAGLVGSGRTEAFEGLVGLRPATARVRIAGRAVAIRHPWQATAEGICYLTEDRKGRGLLLSKGMRENLTLQALAKFGRAFIDRAAEERALDAAVAGFDIRGSRRVRVGNLSGGNQQKLLFAKTMLSDPRILIIDEPTRGIDIGTKQQIYGLIRARAAEGLGIIVISSEMQEVIGLADRVLVMRRGRIAGELSGAEIGEEAIVRLAMGVGGVTEAGASSAGAAPQAGRGRAENPGDNDDAGGRGASRRPADRATGGNEGLRQRLGQGGGEIPDGLRDLACGEGSAQEASERRGAGGDASLRDGAGADDGVARRARDADLPSSVESPYSASGVTRPTRDAVAPHGGPGPDEEPAP